MRTSSASENPNVETCEVSLHIFETYAQAKVETDNQHANTLTLSNSILHNDLHSCERIHTLTITLHNNNAFIFLKILAYFASHNDTFSQSYSKL